MKAVQLIRAWGESEELMDLTVFRQTSNSFLASSLCSSGGNPSEQWQIRPRRNGLECTDGGEGSGGGGGRR
ncbi:hypothetical protein L1987_37978 [Smallanthus sonchifolius]|uniref:Uncharacterized protein n=1 Tax=Smallanthus sonchifolius TaxID=185202 RepID=A0ACB9HJ87_9ASTR|nr:hypothetical protein L1987_37978 [Smallanthus sonchifolius]